MKISKDFSKSEFDSKDGAEMPLDVFFNVMHLAKNLQVLRDYLKRRVIITSGYRSPEHNLAVGGVPGSKHPLGEAGDIKVEGMKPAAVHACIEYLISIGKMKQGGLGIYDGFVHYDIRGTKARWDFRKKTK